MPKEISPEVFPKHPDDPLSREEVWKIAGVPKEGQETNPNRKSDDKDPEINIEVL
jgi:hypothetical protein